MRRWFQLDRRVVISVLAGVAFAAAALHGQAGRTASPAAAASSGPRRIEILFLGHTSTHHDSGRFAPMLKAALAPEGLQLHVHD